MGVFKGLQALWKHTQVTRTRKVQIFQAVVASRLLYGLASAWLNTADRRRLDGFQSRCLRTIYGILPAFVSRVSNFRVLEITQQAPMSQRLLGKQLLLYGKIARAPNSDPLRRLTFCNSSTRPLTCAYVRKLGRPRNEWAVQLSTHVARLETNPADAQRWAAAVNAYVKRT